MSSLVDSLSRRAMEKSIPIAMHVDLTWRCNERCIHCYLDHDEPDALSLADLRDLLDQMAEAGTFFLTLSGGEIFLRRDLFDIIAHARQRGFDVTIKTNAVLIGEKEAARLAELAVHKVQVSVYSDVPEIHDTITKVPGSLKKTLRGIALLRARGIKVEMACVLMKTNPGAFEGVRRLALEYGTGFGVDPTITPHLNGDRSILALNISREELANVYRNESLTGGVGCSQPANDHADSEDDALDSTPCSAGHAAAYISPQGDFYPCVQFPLACGNIRRQRFLDIWRDSPALREVRAIRTRDLPVCSSCSHVGTCSRCPGLAWMEGSMYGPSSADCEKSFVQTGVVSAGMKRRAAQLVQIRV